MKCINWREEGYCGLGRLGREDICKKCTSKMVSVSDANAADEKAAAIYLTDFRRYVRETNGRKRIF